MEQQELIANIVDTLNTITKKSFRVETKVTQTLIKARLKEGFTIDDFRHVICYMNGKWVGTDYEDYLAPTTLFCAKHFETYLQAAKKAAAPAKPRKSEFVQ